MVYKRRRYRRRPIRRRRRVFRRKRARVHRPMKSGNLTVRQSFTSNFTIASTALPFDFIPRLHVFKLGDIDPTQLAAFQRLFTQYRILGAKVNYFCTTSNAAAAGSTMLCKFYSATTFNPYAQATDWITPSQGPESNARVRQKYLGRYQLPGGGSSTTKLIPRAAVQINNPGGPAAGLVVARKNLWLNTTQNFGTSHMGLRTAFHFNEPHPEIIYEVTTSYILQFRNVV